MTQHSCLYEGRVRHRRFAPVKHEFSRRLFMLYADLDELPDLFRGRWFWSCERPNLAWFRRIDHLGDPQKPLAEAVRDVVEVRTGKRPNGPIRMLTHLRHFGIGMNPISVFYCFEPGSTIECILAEVTNTPWGERHCYVLEQRHAGRRGLRAVAEKRLHVSPFFGMDLEYRFQFSPPGERLSIHIENRTLDEKSERTPFDATLMLRRRPLSGRELARCWRVTR